MTNQARHRSKCFPHLAQILFFFLLLLIKLAAFAPETKAYRPPRYPTCAEPYEACLLRQNRHYNSFPIIYKPNRFNEVMVGEKKIPLQSDHAKLVASLTKEQGYEVRCASLPWHITHFLIEEGWAQHFYKHYGGTVTLDGCGAYILSAAGARVPVYRSNEECLELNHKASSYEAFFGSMTPDEFPSFWPENISDQDPTKSGVANHLLTKAQQCKIKVDNLETIAFYCQELAPAEQWCYLNRPIVNSKYDMLTLYGALHQFIHAYRDPYGNAMTCDDIMGTWNNLVTKKPWAIEDNNLTEEIFYDLQDAINNIGFNIENLYRTVFLVISFGQDPWVDDSDTASLTANPLLKENEHVPLVFVFKVPDFLANESRFDDASKVMREVITTKEQQDVHSQQASKRRDELFTKAITRSIGQRFFVGDPIYCPSMPECNPEAGYSWVEFKKEDITKLTLPVTQVKENKIIKNAVIDIINGHHSTGPYACSVDPCPCCKPPVYEDAGDIFTPARLEISERAQFIGKPESSFHPNVEDVVAVGRDFEWKFVSRSIEEYYEGFEFWKEPNLPVRAWIVAPYGIEQEQVLEALQGAFFTKEQQKRLLAENVVVDSGFTGVYPEYFPLKGVVYGLNFAGTACENYDMFEYEDYKFPERRTVRVQECDQDEETGRIFNCRWIERIIYIFPKRQFGKGIGENKPPHLNIFGALVGWGIRKIQETIHPGNTDWHNYFASCERVEDMFLGRCGTNQLSSSDQEINSVTQSWVPIYDKDGNPITMSFDSPSGKCVGQVVKLAE